MQDSIINNKYNINYNIKYNLINSQQNNIQTTKCTLIIVYLLII